MVGMGLGRTRRFGNLSGVMCTARACSRNERGYRFRGAAKCFGCQYAEPLPQRELPPVGPPFVGRYYRDGEGRLRLVYLGPLDRRGGAV